MKRVDEPYFQTTLESNFLLILQRYIIAVAIIVHGVVMKECARAYEYPASERGSSWVVSNIAESMFGTLGCLIRTSIWPLKRNLKRTLY